MTAEVHFTDDVPMFCCQCHERVESMIADGPVAAPPTNRPCGHRAGASNSTTVTTSAMQEGIGLARAMVESIRSGLPTGHLATPDELMALLVNASTAEVGRAIVVLAHIVAESDEAHARLIRWQDMSNGRTH